MPVGMGDDAAVLHSSAREFEVVLSCDWFLEGVHFGPGIHSAEDAGYKALARETSDLAAMGAQPKFFLVSLALPEQRAGKWLDGFAAGLVRGAREFRMVLAGGDTSKFPRVVVNLTVGGEVRRGHALTRRGARPGDQIFVSGILGAAQLGLVLMRSSSGIKRAMRLPEWRPVFEPHLRPRPQIELGRWLVGEAGRRRLASAAIDISDGLSTDLAHLCEASNCGARIWADKLPIVKIPAASEKLFSRCRSGARGERMQINPIQMALHGGEDYQLLFTVPKRLAKQIPSAHHGTEISHIGEILRRRKIVVIDSGRSMPLVARGWDSFSS